MSASYQERPSAWSIGVLISIAMFKNTDFKRAVFGNPSRLKSARFDDVPASTELVGPCLLILALVRKTNFLRFLPVHPGPLGAIAYFAPVAFSPLIAALTPNGLKAKANLSEGTSLLERQLRFAGISSEVFSVFPGRSIAGRFTLAIASPEVATNQLAPLVYSREYRVPHLVATAIMVWLAVHACALANLTTLTRMVGAIVGERRPPFSPRLDTLPVAGLRPCRAGREKRELRRRQSPTRWCPSVGSSDSVPECHLLWFACHSTLGSDARCGQRGGVRMRSTGLSRRRVVRL